MSVLAAMLLSAALPSHAAEEIDITHCYSGNTTIFHESKDVPAALSFVQNGIIMSNAANKLLDSAVVHCEGVQRGLGAQRTGYQLCKIVDKDGDIIIADSPFSGLTGDVKFLEGNGKWKGINGSLRSERIVSSPPGKGAMPGTYQTCRRLKGTFELVK